MILKHKTNLDAVVFENINLSKNYEGYFFQNRPDASLLNHVLLILKTGFPSVKFSEQTEFEMVQGQNIKGRLAVTF